MEPVFSPPGLTQIIHLVYRKKFESAYRENYL